MGVLPYTFVKIVQQNQRRKRFLSSLSLSISHQHQSVNLFFKEKYNKYELLKHFRFVCVFICIYTNFRQNIIIHMHIYS